MKKCHLFWIGLVTGFLLNFTGWLGNNFILKSMWKAVTVEVVNPAWRETIWRHVFSFLPDFVYGFAIVYLIHLLNKQSINWFRNALISGIVVSIVGGITTYFAIANSGFIPWNLAMVSFILVLATKLGVALLAGKWLSSLTKPKSN